MDALIQKSRELCWKIETLPASELQTEISLMASSLSKDIEAEAKEVTALRKKIADLSGYIGHIYHTVLGPTEKAEVEVDAKPTGLVSRTFHEGAMATLRARIAHLEEELQGADSFIRNVNQSLNEGDGTYRP